jgi:leader peptidase (prepilin peptidase)/N-methyltransferase
MTALENLAQPGVFPALSLIVGLLIGSFLNVVIHRLPKMMERVWREQCAELGSTPAETAAEPVTYNLFVPRSSCPACGAPITALQNIPIVSYLWLRGRCARCQSRISARYPIVEAVTGLFSGYLAWHFGPTEAAVAAIVFAWVLIALTGIDLDTQLLPDDITLPLLWGGLLINIGGVFTDLRSAVVGAIVGYLVLWSVYWIFKLLTKKEGMGYGDFKLLAAIGAWLGWQMLPLVILLSALVGAVVGICLIVFARHGKSVPIPFGPYLAGAGLIALLWGHQIAEAYLRNF